MTRPCGCRAIRRGPLTEIRHCAYHASVDQFVERVAALALALDGALAANVRLEARIGALAGELAEARARNDVLADMNERLYDERERERARCLALADVLEQRRRVSA